VTEPAWSAEVLARIAHLHLRAREAVAGWRSGMHRSIRSARGVEFVDYRDYSPGDPIQHLDWKVAARSDRLVVRRHEAETEVPVTIVLDASADMGTDGEGDALSGTKHATAVTLAATLAMFLERQGDPVSLELLGGTGAPWQRVPHRTGEGHLAQLLGVLASVRPDGQAELASALPRILERTPRRGVVVLISDLMEEPETWGPAMSSVVSRRADLRVLHVYSPKEWGLDWSTPARLFSPEGGAPLAIDPQVARSAMQDVVEEYLDEVRKWMVHWRACHVLAPVDGPLDPLLAAVLGGRGAA
jgi:uncharacterized protein (DUF58 family)